MALRASLLIYAFKYCKTDFFPIKKSMHLLPKKYVIEFSIGKILLIRAARNLPRGHVIQMGLAVLINLSNFLDKNKLTDKTTNIHANYLYYLYYFSASLIRYIILYE